MANRILVERLWEQYPWPEDNLPLRKMTVEKLLTYPVQSEYVSDEKRTWKRPTRAWDYGRIRYFFERAKAGETLDPIVLDNDCDGMHIYPYVIMLDGHHRLAGSYFARVSYILASYSGRIDLLDYLRGRRKTCPVE